MHMQSRMQDKSSMCSVCVISVVHASASAPGAPVRACSVDYIHIWFRRASWFLPIWCWSMYTWHIAFWGRSTTPDFGEQHYSKSLWMKTEYSSNWLTCSHQEYWHNNMLSEVHVKHFIGKWGTFSSVNPNTRKHSLLWLKVGVNHGIFHVYHFWNFLIFKCTWKMSIYLSISKMCSSLFRGEIKLARV